MSEQMTHSELFFTLTHSAYDPGKDRTLALHCRIIESMPIVRNVAFKYIFAGEKMERLIDEKKNGGNRYGVN